MIEDTENKNETTELKTEKAENKEKKETTENENKKDTSEEQKVEEPKNKKESHENKNSSNTKNKSLLSDINIENSLNSLFKLIPTFSSNQKVIIFQKKYIYILYSK